MQFRQIIYFQITFFIDCGVERELNEDRKLHKGDKDFQESSAIVYLFTNRLN